MRNKIFGICDPDGDYARMLSHYISRKEKSGITVLAFTKPEAIKEYLRDGYFDALIISESFINLADGCDIETNGIPRDMTFVLAEDKDECGYEFPCVYKYQSCEKILGEILASFNKKRGSVLGKLSGVKVVGVYSPIGRCGKTSFALSLGATLSKTGSTLFVSLDDYSAHSVTQKTNSYSGISDVLYKALVNEEEDFFEDLSIKNIDGMDVLEGASCPEDIYDSDPTVFAKIIEALKKKGLYKNIVIDIGGAVRHPEVLLEGCDLIYMIVVDETCSNKRMDAWEEHMIRKGFSRIVDSSKKIALPDIENIDVFTNELIRQKAPGR